MQCFLGIAVKIPYRVIKIEENVFKGIVHRECAKVQVRKT